jgi:hypothetical protein
MIENIQISNSLKRLLKGEITVEDIEIINDLVKELDQIPQCRWCGDELECELYWYCRCTELK